MLYRVTTKIIFKMHNLQTNIAGKKTDRHPDTNLP